MQQTYDRNTIESYTPEHVPVYITGNGLGGYVSQSIWGTHLRKHQGLFVAAMEPPADRHVLLWDIHFAVDSVSWTTDPAEHGRAQAPTHLRSFIFDGTPHFHYASDGLIVDQRVVPAHETDETHIRYTIHNRTDEPKTLSFTPLFANRAAGDVNDADFTPDVDRPDHGSWLIRSGKVVFRLAVTDVVLEETAKETIGPLNYAYDRAMGDPRDDYVCAALRGKTTVAPGEIREVTFHASLDVPFRHSFTQAINIRKRRMDALLESVPDASPFIRELVMATDPFIVRRASTGRKTIVAGYPWFTDWGRDAMIAFEGLLLKTGRHQDARSVLFGFAEHERHGLIPNMFPEHGGEPLYNTVDASLWFIVAVDAYERHTHDRETLGVLLPTVTSIIRHYEHGTDHGIRMDDDHLIAAGDEDTQLTWMDVRFDGHSVTPRHGKAVEINALWYNALRMAARLAKICKRPAKHEQMLATRVRQSFRKKFWNEQKTCLYDTIDPINDDIRPNMLYAVGLPYSPLKKPGMRRIVDVARDHLEGVRGMLSLSRHDPAFKETYAGSLETRDLAYHMGTAWGFLIGIYVDACHKAYGKKARRMLRPLLKRIRDHVHEDCINGYAEVFDGKDGWIGKGCFTQAWSVAEILRVFIRYDGGGSDAAG